MQIKYIRSLYVNNLGSRNMGRGKNTQTHTKYSIMMLHQQNEKQMWGNEPCKQSRINSITSHTMPQPRKTRQRCLSLLRYGKEKGMKYSFPVPYGALLVPK